MFDRRFIRAASVALGLATILLCSPALLYAAEPTAAELFKQGMKQYADGDFDAARQTLRRVDVMQLSSKEERVTLSETIQDIDRKLQKKAEPAELLQQVDQAIQAGQFGKAAAICQTVQTLPAASDAQKQQASAKLAQVKRLANAKETAARRELEQALSDLNSGQVDKAEKALGQIKSSRVDLGWFDNERVDRALAQIEETKAQAAAVAKKQQEAKAAAEQAKQQAAAKAEAPKVEPKKDAPKAEVAKVEPKSEPKAEPKAEPVAATPAANDVMAQAMKLYAQQRLAEGQQAAKQGQTQAALKAFDEGLAFDPSNESLKAAKADLLAKADQAPKSILDQTLAKRQVDEQATVAEVKALFDRAQTLAKQDNYVAARENVEQAKLTLDRRAAMLSAASVDALRSQATALSADLVAQQNAYDQAQLQLMQQKQAQQEQQAKAKLLMEQNEQVQKLLRRAAELRKEQKYKESLEYINQALFLDPQNVAAQAMKDMIQDTMIYARYDQAERQRAIKISESSVENLEASIPYTELLIYPSEWPELTYRRLRSFSKDASESDLNRRVATRMKESVPINFEGVRLSNVIEYLRNVTGLNIVARWPQLQSAGVDQDAQVTLSLTSSSPVDQALREVLQQLSVKASEPVTYSIVDGWVTISTEKDLTKSVDLRVYDIRDLLVHVPDFGNVPSFDLSSALSGSSGGSSTNIFKDNSSDSEKKDTAVSRQEQIDKLIELIHTSVGKADEWNLDQTSSIKELNGNLIVKTSARNHRQIIDLLSTLRETRAMQISVEARFLMVDQNFLEHIGVDMWITDESKSIADAQYNVLTQYGPELTAPGSTSVPGSLGGMLGTGATAVAPAAGVTSNFGVTYLDDWKVNLFIKATQMRRNALTLTAPRVTFFNGQRAHVTVARQIAFISEVEAVPNSTAFNVTLSYVQSGTTLVVEGTISADRRYVTMTVEPQLATLVRNPPRQIAVSAVANIGNSQYVSSAFIEAPELELTEVKSTVSVPDRGTILMGGQRLVAEVEIEAGVPVLSKIPILNRFFTNNSTVKDERTLLILIKPTIILQSEEEDNLFPGMQQNPNTYNVGRAGSGNLGISGVSGGR